MNSAITTNIFSRLREKTGARFAAREVGKMRGRREQDTLTSPTAARQVPFLSRFGGRGRRLLGALFLTSAMILFGKSAYIYAKAELAQVLLERAFTQTLLTGKPTKAWSWADTRPIARLEIARLGAEAIVLEGSSGEAMAFGPTLQNETARPGTSGTAVISAHRDTHFSFLRNVKVGDVIAVTRDDGLKFSYRVTGMRITDWDRSGIDRHASGFNLVLATCYPFDAITRGKQRYMVEAELKS